MHFWCQWGFSWSMCRFFPLLFGSKTVDDMTWREFLEISIPCGLVTSGDIGLSNLSMVTISLTFYTMVKASSPIFVLFWAYFFGIMEIKWSLCLVSVYPAHPILDHCTKTIRQALLCQINVTNPNPIFLCRSFWLFAWASF